MSTLAALQLEKARKLVRTAQGLAKDGYANDAGRDAYLAVHHAAWASIVDRTGQPAKSHDGAQPPFIALATLETHIDAELCSFVSEALKAVADYEIGEDAEISAEKAAAVVAKAGRFVDCIADLLKMTDNEAAAQQTARKRKE